jgi:hypothetical protein
LLSTFSKVQRYTDLFWNSWQTQGTRTYTAFQRFLVLTPFTGHDPGGLKFLNDANGLSSSERELFLEARRWAQVLKQEARVVYDGRVSGSIIAAETSCASAMRYPAGSWDFAGYAKVAHWGVKELTKFQLRDEKETKTMNTYLYSPKV